MPNPFEFISEIRKMNDHLCARLDDIIKRLDILINIQSEGSEVDWYGDGK